MTEPKVAILERAKKADHLINEWRSGDSEAFNELFGLLHHDIRDIAHRLFARERLNHTLETDDLVSQYYLKMTRGKTIPWDSYVHFLRGAARAMRQILIDHSRTWANRPTGKFGQSLPDQKDAPLKPIHQDIGPNLVRMVQLNQAVEKLSEHEKDLGQIADLHLIVGLTMEEIASFRDESVSKAKRKWSLAKSFILKFSGSGE